jgi:hypothetical protein
MFRGLQLGVKETVAILILITQPCTNRQPERRSRDPSEWRLLICTGLPLRRSLTVSLTVKGVVVQTLHSTICICPHFALVLVGSRLMFYEDYPYKPSSTLQNILCCHEAEKQNGHHSPYFII